MTSTSTDAYVPTRFMDEGSHYDKRKADYAVAFIQALKHTKGRWAGKPFELLGWQERIVRDLFGTVKEDGYRQFTTAYVEIPKKQGKQLTLDTVIPTPAGYTTMGEIQVGDQLFDERGRICRVVAKSPVDYDEQAYRIRFKDGQEIIAGDRHQWVGELTYGKRKAVTITTGELYRRGRDESGCWRFRIPIAAALDLPERVDLPTDPYLMGYWLGNGTATKPYLTVHSCDAFEVFDRVGLAHKISTRYRNVGESICMRVDALTGVLVDSFHDKRIPAIYLRASYQQRLDLLQGLMDSDGSISTRKGQAIYCTTEQALAQDVSELLWSLGVKNAITTAQSTQRRDWSKPSRECGRTATGETLFYVKFTAFTDIQVAGLARKQSRAIERNSASRSHFRYIDSIEPVANPGMQCIQVDSPSHQYLVGRSMLPTHNSELAAAIALLLTCADGEERAEVYGCAADRQQASIVFEVAADMVRLCPPLARRVKILASQKRIVYTPTNSFYQVLSAEAYSKHGFNISGVVFDELHTQPNRALFDVMTKGSGDARTQPLYFLITTAGTNTASVCFEQHQKARDILDGKKSDPTFYPVIYGADPEDDWLDEAVWRKANPSLDITVPIDKVRAAAHSARINPAEENSFRQLRLNQWVKQSIRWMPMHLWDKGNQPIDLASLEGRVCYAGLDLASTTDITALVLVFPPRDEDESYVVVPHFWIPEDNIELRVNRDHVPYDQWEREGLLHTTEGNVVHYAAIEAFIEELGTRYDIREIAYDRWGAVQMSQNLDALGFTVVPFGQGFKDMSPPSKELMKLALEGRIQHGGNKVLAWMVDNIHIRTDPAGNIKPDKQKSTEKIDGVVALIMALDRAIRNGNAAPAHSVYDERGLIVI